MKEEEFFESLLSIPHLKVTSVSNTKQKILIECFVDIKSQPCPACGSNKPKQVRKYERRMIRDLDMSGREVWLHVQVRQFECDCGRYFHESFDWVKPGKSYTLRQAKFIFEISSKQPFKEVGRITNICSKKVERIYYEFAKDVIDLPKRYAQVRKLGIDELALRKGRGEYCCVLADLERGILVDILPTRKKTDLITHFEDLGSLFCNQIEEVSFDMWRPYLQTVHTCFPNARVTIDRFHVVKSLNESLDQFRKKLRRDHPKESVFKKLKWMLFKRADRLSQKEEIVLQKAFEKSPSLASMFELRNQFHDIFDHFNSKEKARQELGVWVDDVERTNNPKWNKFLGTLDSWQDYILNFVESRITNAATEGLNNLIRYINRISYAIPNFEHMRLRVLANSC